jgi:outer membrane protein OmpA-like peptidoglycan-associated protein
MSFSASKEQSNQITIKSKIMSKKTRYVLGILLTIIICSILHWWMCTCCEKSDCCKKDAVEETSGANDAEVDKLSNTGFSAYSDAGAGVSYASNENYNFNQSESTILSPVSAGVLEGVGKVKSFLDENPTQVFNVVGHYKSSETNSSAFPNLGLARANAVKNHLQSQGVESKRITTSGKLAEDFVLSGDTLFGPVTFGFSKAANSSDWAALGDKIRANPLVLYFNTAQASINLTEEQKQKVADITNYIDHVDGAKCLAIGHTDSKGNRTTNVRLGKERADFAKAYLVKNGISEGAIVVSSEGPDKPTADNATEEGRAKNRRTVVTIN